MGLYHSRSFDIALLVVALWLRKTMFSIGEHPRGSRWRSPTSRLARPGARSTLPTRWYVTRAPAMGSAGRAVIELALPLSRRPRFPAPAPPPRPPWSPPTSAARAAVFHGSQEGRRRRGLWEGRYGENAGQTVATVRPVASAARGRLGWEPPPPGGAVAGLSALQNWPGGDPSLRGPCAGGRIGGIRVQPSASPIAPGEQPASPRGRGPAGRAARSGRTAGACAASPRGPRAAPGSASNRWTARGRGGRPVRRRPWSPRHRRASRARSRRSDPRPAGRRSSSASTAGAVVMVVASLFSCCYCQRRNRRLDDDTPVPPPPRRPASSRPPRSPRSPTRLASVAEP